MPKLTRPALLGAVLVAVAVAGAAGYFALGGPSVDAAKSRVESAEPGPAKQRALQELWQLGPAGRDGVVSYLSRPDAAPDAVAVLAEREPDCPAETWALHFAAACPEGRLAMLVCVPALTPYGLASGNAPAVKVLALRLAAKSGGLVAESAQLLRDPDAGVRLAAVVVLGPVHGDAAPLVGEEELAGLLNDPDPAVAREVADALTARGLSPSQVAMAKQLRHPDPAERLSLLVDLAQGAAPDAGPWLERLSRDPDPAVRLGAARVAGESRSRRPGWLARLAESDADATVRHWAGYYLKQTRSDVTPASHLE